MSFAVPSWLETARRGSLRHGLLLSAGICAVSANVMDLRIPAGPGYEPRSTNCPGRCKDLGPDPLNWSLYHNLDQLNQCNEIIFHDFNVNDYVDDPDEAHHIYSCSSYGPDWSALPPSNANSPKSLRIASTPNVTYETGWWADGTDLAAAELTTLTRQMRQYIAKGFAPTDRPALLFAKFGAGSIGVYIGKGLQNEGVGAFALEQLDGALNFPDTISTDASGLVVQFCEEGQNADHIFGVIVTSNRTFGAVQRAIKSWSVAECQSFHGSRNALGPLPIVTPLAANSTNVTGSAYPTLSHRGAKSLRARQALYNTLASRGHCSTVQVASGDSCASLAKKCDISASDFTKYNPGKDFCATLKPYQHVCCSAGSLPDFAPKELANGSCATYTVRSGDNCPDIAAQYSLTVDELKAYNKETWAWNGCTDLWAGTVICLSKGSPPMPAPLSNAVCGPQKPGTKQPPAGADLSKLNPCPLNACCDIWGQVNAAVS